MRVNKHQQLVLAIAALLAFGIWLFPHWRIHAHYRSQNVWHDSGYGFLFRPPTNLAGLLREKLSTELPGIEVTVVLDWQRQFYEWGTLVFLTGFALAGLAVRRSC